MSVQEIETAITKLPAQDLVELANWFDEYREQMWDDQIARDVQAGRFDEIRQRIRQQLKAGECRPL